MDPETMARKLLGNEPPSAVSPMEPSELVQLGGIIHPNGAVRFGGGIGLEPLGHARSGESRSPDRGGREGITVTAKSSFVNLGGRGFSYK
jgi:hypothetical protein